ncbi:hypothetical protein GGQ69_000836 [Micrococcus sp. TA1]|nr:hypothetical protein [Micrococcus sp. TA1]
MDARCDRYASERAVAIITLIPSMVSLYACNHHAQAWMDQLEARGDEFEVYYPADQETLLNA